MQHGVVHFQNIRVPLPVRRIYARLGFKKGLTELTPAERERMDRVMEDAAVLVSIKGAVRAMDIRHLSTDAVILEDGSVFPGRSLSGMLKGSSGVLLMGATAGQTVMDAIASCSEDNLSRAVVLDAVASEMTDAALDWIMDYAGQDLIRSARRLTKMRFSAGYGDLSLESQEVIHGLLRLDEIGVTITETRIMVPEKSVTAIAGILHPTG